MSTANTPELTPSLQDQLKETVNRNPVVGRHSYFQLKYFIINKEPTVQAKLWKCLQEMKGRTEALESIRLEREDILDRIELTKLELERLNTIVIGGDPSSLMTFSVNPDGTASDVGKKERIIKERQIKRRLSAIEGSLKTLEERQKSTEEEAAFFLQAFNDLEKIEKVKPFDDHEAQSEYWNARYSNELNMKLMLERRVDVELAKGILSMPDKTNVKQELINLLTQQQSAMLRQQSIDKKKLAVEKEKNDRQSDLVT